MARFNSLSSRCHVIPSSIKVFLGITLFSLGLGGVHSAGAGRAFPIKSENYVIEQFQGVNPNIVWDPTNYLIDLSGHYANCKYVGIKGALNDVREKTPEGLVIGIMVDYARGEHHHTNAVNGYLKELIDDWMRDGTFNREIRNSERFGCSVRPGCKRNVAVACLFGRKSDERPAEVVAPPPEWVTPPTRRPTPRPTPRPTRRPTPRPTPRPIIHGKQAALAFTKEQYDVAESIVGTKWDRSHYLENLSGFEARCDMIGATKWFFNFAEEEAARENMIVTGLFDHAENRGSTPEALEKILKRMLTVPPTAEVGCSIIPDCVKHNTMYVVVTCLYDNV